MLLTNSNQITLGKVEQCCTLQFILSDMQLTDDGLNELSKSEIHGSTMENEMERRVREMEDEIFQESVDIFNLLNDTNVLIVDGQTYRRIQQSKQLLNTLRIIRENTPIYQHLNKRQKYTLINQIAQNYVEKLNNNHQFDCQKEADIPKNQSQNQCETTKFRIKDKIQENCNTKTKPVHRLVRKTKNERSNKGNKKRVRISQVSFCKYFCALQAPGKIRQSQINSMETF